MRFHLILFKTLSALGHSNGYSNVGEPALSQTPPAIIDPTGPGETFAS
jgi:hypothetical protein